jgi:hypothetical protein
MKRKFDEIYQFKVSIDEIKPLIWRQIQVPSIYTFWDLHVAIADSMGWLDYHLHMFELINPKDGSQEIIGYPDEDRFEDNPVHLPGWQLKIADYFNLTNNKSKYIYDFGDNWIHTITLEKILPRNKGVKYPVCIDGKRRCPPEDCGGISGYENFLEIIMDPDDEEYESMLVWAGGNYDPEDFIPSKVKFWDPAKRFKIAFSQ